MPSQRSLRLLPRLVANGFPLTFLLPFTHIEFALNRRRADWRFPLLPLSARRGFGGSWCISVSEDENFPGLEHQSL
jgi:hypothetical protein